MDSCHRELELNAKLAVCMNEATAVEAIKETKVNHTAKIKEAEVHHAAKIKEVEVCHRTTIKEAKLHCTTRITEAKVCHTTNSYVLQQTHRESLLALECEVIAEEGQDHQAFVEASTAAL